MGEEKVEQRSEEDEQELEELRQAVEQAQAEIEQGGAMDFLLMVIALTALILIFADSIRKLRSKS